MLRKIIIERLCTPLFLLALCLPYNIGARTQDSIEVYIYEQSKTAEMSNGIIRAGLNSSGQVNNLIYKGKSLVSGGGRFYFGYTDDSKYRELSPSSVRVGMQSQDIAEVIYTSVDGPLTIEQSFVMLRGVSGLYCYIVIKSEKQAVRAREIRVVHRLNPVIFNFGYVADDIQGPMVTPQEISNATQIMDATYQLSDGSIYTKYDWANYVADDLVHGLMGDTIGVWVISASDEYLNGGPMKQELMVHATNKTPLVLKMFQGEHFGASAQTFNPPEEKLYGPYFVYINSGTDHDAMISDAKQVAQEEVELWPYSWMEHPLYPLNRSTVSGKIHIENNLSPEGLMVVLAQPGATLYNQGKEYMFWAKTDANGDFSIPHVRLGDYSLYAFATTGQITDELQMDNISVSESETNLGTLTWSPTKYEHLLWQIGRADRKACEFKLGEVPRRYGLWEEVPANLTFVVDSSDASMDWYYAQTKYGNWTVQFNLAQEYTGDAVLTVAIAGAASEPRVEVSVNGSKVTTMSFGNDGSVYRSANTSGRYELRVISFPASLLQLGENTIAFKMLSVGNRGGLMYDIIKLEAGNPVTSTAHLAVNTPKEFILDQNYPNPFNPETTIQFEIPENSDVKLGVYNILGQEIAVLVNDFRNAGTYSVSFNGSNIPSGIYFYRLESNGYNTTKQMLLLK